MIVLWQWTYCWEKSIVHQTFPSTSPIPILNLGLVLFLNTSSSFTYILRRIKQPTALLSIKLPFNDLTSKVVIPIWMTDTIVLEVKDFSYFLSNNVHPILGDHKTIISVQQNILVDFLAVFVS